MPYQTQPILLRRFPPTHKAENTNAFGGNSSPMITPMSPGRKHRMSHHMASWEHTLDLPELFTPEAGVRAKRGRCGRGWSVKT